MNEDNRQEKIELYLQGKLEEQSRHDFEEQLKQDKALQEDVKLSREIEKAINEVEGEELFKENLSRLGDKYVVAEAPKNNGFFGSARWLVIILLVVVLAVVGYFLWQQSNTSNAVEPEQIFASYYEPYTLGGNTRSNGNVDEDYSNAIKAYDNGNYSEAIESFTQRVAANPDDISTQLLLGNCYLNISPPETQTAIELFKPIAEGGSELYATTAKWYLAFAYLQDNQTEEAKAIFEDISNNNSGRYTTLAKQILSDWK